MTPDEARSALQELNRCFSIEEAKALAEIASGNSDDFIDPDSRFHNVFFHEMCPCIVIAEYKGFDRIKFTEKNQRHDAKIFTVGIDAPTLVECTAAIDGQQDAMRMKHMEKYGRAPAHQEIKYTGTKNNRVIHETESEFQDVEERNQNVILPLLRNAVKQKVDQAGKNPDYFGAVLSVVFDDWCAPIPEKKSNRFDGICRDAVAENPAAPCVFSNIFIVGISGAYLFDSNKDASVILPEWD